jgi:hypothetical protein
MASTPAPMIPLGYGKFVRADRIFAVVPIETDDRGDGRRTYVHIEGIAEPLIASRSERAILADLEEAAGGAPRRRRPPPGQGELPV